MASNVARSIFLLDASALSSTPCRKTWDFCPASHQLDTSKRLLACFGYLREKQPKAQILTLLEPGGFGQLMTEWRKGSDELIVDASSTLQCVPFGCRVAAFLVELAAQRSAKGFDIAIISNDVDIVVASRVAGGAKWRHLGFMFVDDEFILPGLSLAGNPEGTATISNCSGRRPSQTKIDHLRVQKTISETHNSQCRAGVVMPSVTTPSRPDAQKACKEKTILGLEQEALADSDIDGASLESSPSSQAKQEICHAKESSYSSVAGGSPNSGMNIVEKPIMEIGGADLMYADTQIDFDMSNASAGVAIAETPCKRQRSQQTAELEQAMDESPLQPTIEQDGPPEVVPSTQQQVAPLTQRTEFASAQAEDVAQMSEASLVTTKNTFEVDECSRMVCDQGRVAEVAQAKRASSSNIEPPLPTQTLEMDTSRKELGAPSEIVVVEDEASLAVAAQAMVEAIPTVPADIEGLIHTTVAKPKSCSQGIQVEPVVTEGATSSMQQPRRRIQIRRLGSHKRQLSSASLLESNMKQEHPIKMARCASRGGVMNVDALLGDWVRNGGRTHSVRLLQSVRGESSVIEFQPSAGNSLPIEQAEGVWLLNGYALDEGGSTKDVLRWQHAISGATRLWWRPDAEAPPDELSSRETPSSPKPVHG